MQNYTQYLTPIFVLFFVLITAWSVMAQDQAVPKLFQTQARAADSVTLKAGENVISLWGVERLLGASPNFDLKARTALENLVGSQKIKCETQGQDGNAIVALCENAGGIDLGLSMVQQGYVSVDRADIYGSRLEQIYLDAEKQAQDADLGVWGVEQGRGQGESGGSGYLLMGFAVFAALLMAFMALSLFIMRGFKRVTDVQEANTEMISRERALRDKEREIFAMMLDSEIKSNKSKIEAYVVVYDEMLKALKDPERPPAYKKAGDIVQAQPVLDRAVFDRNTDKLDILGEELSSEVIHFYARIKTKPDYINLEPDMPLDQAIDVVEKALKNGTRLDKLADRLIDRFGRGGHDESDLKIGEASSKGGG